MRTRRERDPPVSIELRRTFRASAERVFQAWTEPATLRQWWCPPGWTATAVDIDLRVGGSYRIAMTRIDGSDTVAVCGQFLEVIPPERLVFSWRWDGAFDGGETRVVLQLRDSAGLTELVLRHERFADEQTSRQHWSGWLAACGRFDRVLLAGD